MDPQTNQDYNTNTDGQSGGMATMPMPTLSDAPTQQPISPTNGGQMPYTGAGTTTSGTAQSAQGQLNDSTPYNPPSLNNPPVPALAPPLSTHAAAPQAQPITNDTAGSSYGRGVASPNTSPTGTLSPEVAADTDVIEKAWVVRAKQVVVETQSDPFKQSREINRLKAEYMKKRYNKDIKLPGA